ncbi:MAG: endolytic transglycosylase MltG [Oscillospiraceae bacterium]
MSDNRDDFWRELMGEDPPPKKDEYRPEDAAESSDLGFTVEYLSRDGDRLPGSGKPEDRESPVPPLEDFEAQDPAPQPEKRPPERERPAERRAEQERRRDGEEKREKDPAEDFEVDFDFDKEYEDVEEKPVRRGRTKRTGCLGGIMMFLFVICISAVLACVGWMAATDVLGLDSEDAVVEVTIPKSIFSDEEREKEGEGGEKELKTVSVADIDCVTDVLYEQGLIKYKWLFKIYAKFSTADEKIKAGTYELNLNYDYRALVNGMTPSGGIRVTTDVTIPEGYTITQIVTLLSDSGVCDKNELLDALANYDFDYDFLDDSTLGDPKRLEGYLFPDTYTFYVGDTATRVINKLLTNFDNKWTDEFDTKAEALGYTMHEVLTVASMVEKEAGGDSERATIASVIYNRLENPGTQGTVGLLQIDATIYYVIADTGEAFSTEIDSPYNTYMYEGLTPGPIANPGLASIKAALDPDSTSYYYYALGKDGLHQFFQTYNGFQNFINSNEYGG